jgi:hypothetical protein
VRSERGCTSCSHSHYQDGVVYARACALFVLIFPLKKSDLCTCLRDTHLEWSDDNGLVG